jgi:hypothetical protein
MANPDQRQQLKRSHSMTIFKTREVLAAIHAFPGLMAAREHSAVMDAFDHLRNISPQLAGVEFERGQLEWCALSQAMRPALRRHFSELASERWPDPSYWNNPAAVRKRDAETVARLGEWVSSMEKKYGPTQDVPNISAEVRQHLNLQL